MLHTYTQAIELLNTMVPELHTKPGQPRRKFSLDEIRVLLAELGDPQKKFRSLLIAGTNGKGSTAATLASILTAAGAGVGLYTSPHLERPNERIRIGREEIRDSEFAQAFFRVYETAVRLVQEGRLAHLPSYFELLTAQAFIAFSDAGIEIAVLEVGLGGRLDATNVVDPLLSVITDISLDHTEWLGPTITAITREKAGILRPQGTLITLPQHPDANQVLGEVAIEQGVRGVSAAEYMPGKDITESGSYKVRVLGEWIDVQSPLSGAHQQRNIALAIAAAVELAEQHNISITPEAIAVGIQQTQWPGRLERISAFGVQWILDVAHNPAGVWALRAGLQQASAKVLVFGCLKDKPLAEMGQILFPLFEQVICAPIRSPRATPIEELTMVVETAGVKAVAAESVVAALQRAAGESQGEPVVVSGSVYLVGEARRILTSSGSGKA